MRITNSQGDTFILSILGYQFSQATGDYWDDSWLMVRLTISVTGRTWVVTDPCLTTLELQYMIDWFQQLMDLEFKDLECDFTEPAFKLVVFQDAIQRYLQIQVSPIANLFMDEDNTLIMDIPLGDIPFRDVIDGLKNDQLKYPIRS